MTDTNADTAEISKSFAARALYWHHKAMAHVDGAESYDAEKVRECLQFSHVCSLLVIVERLDALVGVLAVAGDVKGGNDV